MRSTRTAWLFLALLLGFASGGHAYTIVLKNGTTLEAARKYGIRPDGKATVTLTDGTTRVIEIALIDVKKTEEVNRANDDSVVVLDAGRSGTPQDQAKTTLEDMHRSGARPSAAERPPATRETPLALPNRGGEATGGTSRRALANSALAAELANAFQANGVEGVKFFQGSDGRRPVALVSTPNEASIFRALDAAAKVLIAVRQTSVESLATLELTLEAPGGGRAGQFVITPEQAKDLADGKIDTAKFFVRYVQF